MGLSNRNRDKVIRSIEKTTHDLLIIGGGLTGASIILDATARGMDTVLIEMGDYGSGSSARYSLLINVQEDQGLHSWKQIESEKDVIANNFSALYHSKPALEIYYRGDSSENGLKTIRKNLLSPLKRTFNQRTSEKLRKNALLKLEPGLNPEKLDSGLLYSNGIIDRAAMTIELLKKANQLGAKMMNYLKVCQFIYDEKERIIGVEVEDQITGATTQIFAHRMINATGSSIDQIRKLDSSNLNTHFPPLINKISQFYIDDVVPSIDHIVSFDDQETQMQFLIMLIDDRLLVTATEKMTKPISFKDTLTDEKIKLMLIKLNQVFLNQKFMIEDVKDKSISYEIINHKKNALSDIVLKSDSGLISVLGTSLASYRSYASAIVSFLAKTFKKELSIFYSDSDTKIISINKENQTSMEDLKNIALELSISDDQLKEIIDSYGDNARGFLSYVEQSGQYSSFYKIDRLICAEILYNIKETAIYTPIDFFARRSKLNYQRTNLSDQLNGILTFLADQLKWTTEERSYFERELRIWLKEQGN